MLMLQHGHVMAIILVENGNHHVTTHALHKIMTGVMGQYHRALTIRRGVGKIALIGRTLNGFAFEGFYNVYCEINRFTV
jgi:hypothetical protein